ncbi:unnamed protein product [Staurois parvus]|uniref:Uncharacterized protein n=1 Tax=Staurois parvus TaxID=386267 RepID=A0ABN9EJD3_9NEOB|nr:unnamed protein product [Staurois parvus]
MPWTFLSFQAERQSKCRQGTGQSSRDKIYVKCIETAMFYYIIIIF